MDPANAREGLREAELDARQGADVLMVKPALPYLDVIRAVRERFDLPVAASERSRSANRSTSGSIATSRGNPARPQTPNSNR